MAQNKVKIDINIPETKRNTS